MFLKTDNFPDMRHGSGLKLHFIPLLLIVFCAIIIFITVTTGLDVTKNEDQQNVQVASMRLGLLSAKKLSDISDTAYQITFFAETEKNIFLPTQEDFINKWLAETPVIHEMPDIGKIWAIEGVNFILTSRSHDKQYEVNLLVVRPGENNRLNHYWVKLPLKPLVKIWQDFNQDLKWQGAIFHKNHPWVDLSVVLKIDDTDIQEVSRLEVSRIIEKETIQQENLLQIPDSDFAIYLNPRQMGWHHILNQESLQRIASVVFVIMIALFVIIEQTRSLLRLQKSQYRAMRMLEQSEERLKDLVQSSADYLWSMDENFRFTYISPTITDELFVGSEFFMSHRLEDMTDPDYEQEERHATLDAFTRYWPIKDKTFKFITRENQVFYLRISGISVFNKSHQFIGYRGTARNVTAEKQAMIVAEKSRIRLLDALNTSPDGFVLFDQDDNLVLFNTGFEKLFFMNDRSFLRPGRKFIELQQRIEHKNPNAKMTAPLDQKDILEKISQIDKPHTVKRQYEEIMELSNGSWVLSSVIRMQTGDLVCLFRDITRLKENETALKIAKEKAESADKTKSEFLAFMGHELRSPLNAIIGFSEILKNHLHGPLGEAVYDDYVHDIHDSGLHLMTLVNDLLDFSKIEAGKMTLQEELIDLEAIVRSACTVIKERARKDHINLNNQIQNDLLLAHGILGIYADGGKIKQMLINLLTNAIKFTPSGGCVNLKLKLDPENGFDIIVSDNGIGIAAENIDKVFEAYEQIDSYQGRRHKGTGLGMPLTKKLMNLHEGDIYLTSAPGKGTKVTLHFPEKRLVQQD